METHNSIIRQRIGKYGGILIASLYGLLMRIGFGVSFKNSDNFADLFSITFVWIVPVIIGAIPLMFASNKELEDYSVRVNRPVAAVLCFFLFCFWSGREDIICVLIISIPFLLGAAFGGMIFGSIILRNRKAKGIVYSLVFLPLLIGLVEGRLPTPSANYEVRTPIRIASTRENIWNNIVRVRPITNKEYTKGFFHYAGIPRPLYAELDKDTIGATRTGHFEGGLTFKESVMEWQRYKKVSFDIQVVPASIGTTIFDQHILKGNHFKFLNASYELRQINKSECELTLVSSYQLDTKINGYGAFWGNTLVEDFQQRLLDVIKQRCEQK